MGAVWVVAVMASVFGLSEAAPLATDTTGSSSCLFPTDICGTIVPGSRIVGGATIQQNLVPYQAQICVRTSTAYQFNCGGTLISKHAVLTAAHCFLYSTNPADYTINLGKQNSDQTVQECNADQYVVTSFVTHSQFSSTLLTNDIALAFIASKYNQPVHFTDYILPACLPFPDQSISSTTARAAAVVSLYSVGTMCQVTGWGKLSETATSAATTLQAVSLPITSTSTCASAYASMGVPVNASSQFCASMTGKDACAGDSGGPMVVQSNGKYVVIGIVSYGKGCAEAGYPGVYTNVAFFTDWIVQTYTNYLQQAGLANCTSCSSLPTTTGSTTYSTTTVSTTTTTTAPTTTTTTPSTTTTTTPSPVALKYLGPICQGQYTYVNCPPGQTMTVQNCFNGRADQSACRSAAAAQIGMMNPVTCSNANALPYMRSACNGQNGCWVGMYPGADPCPNVDKYTVMTFSCA